MQEMCTLLLLVNSLLGFLYGQEENISFSDLEEIFPFHPTPSNESDSELFNPIPTSTTTATIGTDIDLDSIFTHFCTTENLNEVSATATPPATPPSTTTAASTASGICKQCGLYFNKVCVMRSDCRTSALLNGKLHINLRNREGKCHYLEDCCHPDDHVRRCNCIFSKQNLLNNFIVYWQATSFDMPLTNYDQCGAVNTGGIYMTVTSRGLETSFAEFPWAVAIVDTQSNLVCNGALIDHHMVLTAASCLPPYASQAVRAGDWDLLTDKEMIPHETRTVRHVTSHPDFNLITMQNDIALLTLDSGFSRTQHMAPVCLPKKLNQPALSISECFAIGWNVLQSSRIPMTRNILNKVDMDRRPCPNDLGPKVFCTVNRKPRPIEGIGAPLVCPTETGKHFIVGTWSLRDLSGPREINYFTDVGKYSDWITETINKFPIFYRRNSQGFVYK